MNALTRSLVVVCTFGLLVSCEPPQPGRDLFTPLDALLVLPQSIRLDTAQSAQLGAQRFLDGSSTDRTATARWTSDRPTVATVSSKGTVEAVGRGTATITAEVDGVRATATVIVDVPPLQIRPFVLSLTYTEFNRTSKYKDGGLVRFADGGLAVFPDGGFFDGGPPPNEYESAPFAILELQDDGTRVDVGGKSLWGSSDTSVAAPSGDGGFFTAAAAGEATVTGIYDGQTITGTVSVTEIPECTAKQRADMDTKDCR
jgi:hypothetical protein